MKIKEYKWFWIVGAALAGLFSSCSSKVDFGEQYQKTICIIHSKGMLHPEIHYYKRGANVDTATVSIYCAGSEPLKHDLRVDVAIDPQAVDSLNKMGHVSSALYMDKVILPERNYKLLSSSVILARKTQYQTLDIEFNMDGLDPAVSYVIPVSIVGNSSGYAVNPDMQTIIYEISMKNGYSGNFGGTSTDAGVRSVQPSLKAMSHNQVRMPIHNLDDEITNLDTNFMLLTVTDDSTSVSILPWKNANVTDKGGSTYDTKRQQFVLNYSYMNGSDVEVNVVEKIRNIENNYEEEIEADKE